MISRTSTAQSSYPAPSTLTLFLRSRHVYPVPRVSPLDNGPVYPISEKDLVRIEKQVQTVANLVNYDAGNIAALIAKDLSSSAAEHELALLPQEYGGH